MDFKQIQELVKMINKSNIGELSIEENDFKITIKQKKDHVTQVVSAPVGVAPQMVQQVAASAPVASVPAATTETGNSASSANTITIKSPMIGTFYRKPAPEKPNYVEEGDSINPGKVICVIEAMKLFNEIESEISGKIVKILVDDASPVEFDQPLFIVEP
ncbi:MAG: acetyl-CoA carboxylase biotin carboxyl carrier protein [Chitinophagaceae bacterium]|nr:MAG: acetyl-CoA carboxylase biotin carboxyl carrier protein [Chitinophagaceae bacterium]